MLVNWTIDVFFYNTYLELVLSSDLKAVALEFCFCTNVPCYQIERNNIQYYAYI